MWKKLWMNLYGYSLIISISIFVLEQIFDFSYKMLLLKNLLEQYYLVQGGFKCIDLNDIEFDFIMLVVFCYWDFFSGWQCVINLCWSFDYFIQGEIINIMMLFYFGVMISCMCFCGGLMLIWGDL